MKTTLYANEAVSRALYWNMWEDVREDVDWDVRGALCEPVSRDIDRSVDWAVWRAVWVVENRAVLRDVEREVPS